MSQPTMQRESGWLLFDAALPLPSPSNERDPSLEAALLELGASLPGGCKIAFVARSGLRLRSERFEPVETRAAAGRAQAEAEVARDFDTALRTLDSWPPGPVVGAAEDPIDQSLPDLPSLCREAGWPFEEQPDGSLRVDLRVEGAYVTARIGARAQGLDVAAELLPRLPSGRGCREALAALGLRLNGAFRMVRLVPQPIPAPSEANGVFDASPSPSKGEISDGSLREIDRADESALFLEAPLRLDATASELGAALGAVALAARHSALEARLLAEDERIARAFTSRCRRDTGMPPARGRTQGPRENESVRLDDHVGRKSRTEQGGE